MPKPTTHRTPTQTTPESRVDGLASPDDATVETFAEVNTAQPLAARNGEHGHVDGPRGHQDFHIHDDPPGDQPHGHKRGSLLGRTAGLDEWVPPLAATDPPGADQTADLTPAGTPGAGDAPEPSAAGAASRPGAGSGAAGAGRSLERRDDTHAASVRSIDRLTETEAKIRLRLAEVEIVKGLAQLAARAANQLDYDDLVSPDVIRQGKDTFNGWAQGRGVS